MYYLMQLHVLDKDLEVLIRNENDRGIIVSFDDRLINSNYKNFFEQTLENYRQKKGDIQQFGKIIKTNSKKKSKIQSKIL